MELRFKRLSEEARIPVRSREGDAGLDLHAAEPAHIGPGERWQVKTGLAVEIPSGHAGLVLPRSGLALKHGISLVNSPGLIDPGFRGEIGVLLLNNDPADIFRIEPGDRIAQLLVVGFSELTPVETADLSETERGDGGFGSTGR